MSDIVMQEQGKPFRSKPYRFRSHNGTFAVLETDWSCFINPWSWKVEFVIGQHRVVQVNIANNGPMIISWGITLPFTLIQTYALHVFLNFKGA